MKPAKFILIGALLIGLIFVAALLMRQDQSSVELSSATGSYSIELVDAARDGYTVYIRFLLTAPADADLSSVTDLRNRERLSFREADVRFSACSAASELKWTVTPGPDAQANTVCLNLQLRPAQMQGEPDPFGAGQRCTVRLTDLIHWGCDIAYEQKLIAEKYSGDPQFVPQPEEFDRIYPQTVLASEAWEFEIPMPIRELGTAQLLEHPTAIKAVVIRTDPGTYTPDVSVEEVTVTSVLLTPSELTVRFLMPGQDPPFDCVFFTPYFFPETAASPAEPVRILLRDGTVKCFTQLDGAKDTAILYPETPVDVAQVEALYFLDGTVLYVDER